MAPEERPLRGAADIAIPGIAIDHYLQFRFRGCGSASAADLKFLSLWPRVRLGTSNPNAALES